MVDLIFVDGKRITPRVHELIVDAATAAKVPIPKVVQGSYSTGVAASAKTHDGGGAVDLSIRNLTPAQQIRFVVECRKRFGDSWIRTPKYGWNGDPHIHMIVADEPGLSAGAKNQVVAYNAGLNGLANKRRDVLPRPTQHSLEEVQLMASFPKPGSRQMIKTPAGKDVLVKSDGKTPVTLGTITLPKGADYDVSAQLRVPRGLPALAGTPAGAGIVGEMCLGRRGWGDAAKGDLDETGHNPVLTPSTEEAWRTPIHHNIIGGGPLELRLLLPKGNHRVRFVYKAVRVH